MMDEPSCGLDPMSRENLWRIVNEIKKLGISVLLTSHSMEEASMLCESVGILSDGILKVTGSQHELKRKFGEGIDIQVQG